MTPPFGGQSGFELPDDVFRLLCSLLYEKSGMRFADSNKYFLEKRLAIRAKDLNLDSFRRYYQYLRYDAGAEVELDRIWDVITTNETYFFREENQLRAFVDEIVPELIEAKKAELEKTGLNRKPKLRLWSAGCSTGEEPYTIAMMCMEAGIFEQADVDLFASDISGRVISRARQGIYRETSFRSTSEAMRRKYFEPQPDGTSRVRDEVRNRVTFGRLNLYDTARVDLLGMLDVVFCRNVIIYFDDDSKRRVIGSFHRRLLPGGFLLLGHSESLISLTTDFKLRHLKSDMVYQR